MYYDGHTDTTDTHDIWVSVWNNFIHHEECWWWRGTSVPQTFGEPKKAFAFGNITAGSCNTRHELVFTLDLWTPEKYIDSLQEIVLIFEKIFFVKTEGNVTALFWNRMVKFLSHLAQQRVINVFPLDCLLVG
jgi:hypothetical protein